MTLTIILLIVLFLSYSNGANDNFKGVATLYGSGLASYKTAIIWATIFTAAGVITSAFFAQALVKNFSGKGLVPDVIITENAFVMAVAFAAGLTVIIAARIGMPISTTHGLVGALVGAGLVAVGPEVNFGKLGKSFVLPLLLSPILSAFLSWIFYLITKNISSSASKILDKLHFLTAGIVSFARGLNDGPKIAGMLLIVNWLSLPTGLILIAISMALGGWLNSKKVAETMSQKITAMDSNQAFSANFVTGILVISASVFGLPVSTTHVSVGSLAGIGLVTGKLDKQVLRNILLSWVLTLPIAAAFSALFYFVFKIIF